MQNLRQTIDEFEQLQEKNSTEGNITTEIDFRFGKDMVILNAPVIVFNYNGTKYCAAEGVYCTKYNNEKEYMPDWSLTWIWPAGKSPIQYSCFESSSLATTLYNFAYRITDGAPTSMYQSNATIVDKFQHMSKIDV